MRPRCAGTGNTAFKASSLDYYTWAQTTIIFWLVLRGFQAARELISGPFEVMYPMPTLLKTEGHKMPWPF